VACFFARSVNIPTVAKLVADGEVSNERDRCEPACGPNFRIVASLHLNRLEHDPPGVSVSLRSSRFRLGGKKEAAGVCRSRGESMEFQSKLACNQIVIQKQ
jgi:hypothetical protein